MSRTALIIGATGSFGAHALIALERRGWAIRALARDPAAAARKCGENTPVQWIKGDAMDPAEVTAAAMGCQLIIHAANPPGYRNWRGLALPMLAASIAAAKAAGARIVLPGNVYNYAPDAGRAIAEDAPQAPATRKGKVRVEMEAMLRAASGEGVRSLILRAGDFFGPAAPNSALNWLTRRSGGRLTAVLSPGAAGHAFAYLPDLAQTLAMILEREAELADCESFHFAGHWIEGREGLVRAVRRVLGDERIPLRPFPYALVIALSPFVTMFRELLEMRYLWNRPIGLDQAKLEAFLGKVPATPLDCALRASLIDLGIEAKNWTRGGAQSYIAAHAGQNAV